MTLKFLKHTDPGGSFILKDLLTQENITVVILKYLMHF